MKSPGRLRILIHIQLGDDIPSARFSRELIQRRREHSARPAPGSPAIHQHRRISGFCQCRCERLIRQCNRMIRRCRNFQRRMATPANRPTSTRINPVFRTAFWTYDDRLHNHIILHTIRTARGEHFSSIRTLRPFVTLQVCPAFSDASPSSSRASSSCSSGSSAITSSTLTRHSSGHCWALFLCQSPRWPTLLPLTPTANSMEFISSFSSSPS
jgi:hypothetical protein